MVRIPWLAAAALALAGCAPTAQEVVREHAQHGLHLYRNGSYAHARDSFRAALALHPDDADLVYNLARCHDQLGQPGEAERLYLRCLKLAPDHAEARHAWAVLAVNSGRRAEAAHMVEQWLKARPRRAAPYVEDGWLRLHEGDLDAARARLQQALDFEPRNTRALVELAGVYERLNRADRAVVLYERALATQRDQPAVRKRLEALQARGVSRPRPD